MARTRILDACCGSRMFWYDRDNKYTVYQDNRELDTTLCDGQKSWIAQKYGVLPKTWKEDIAAGFRECFRVLRPFGTLIFKWNEEQIPFNDVIKLAPELPLFGDKRGKTRWVVFCKGARACD